MSFFSRMLFFALGQRDEFGLPDELDRVITNAIERGKQKMKRVSRRNKRLKGAGLFLVALAAALTVGVNAVPSFAESLSDVGAGLGRGCN